MIRAFVDLLSADMLGVSLYAWIDLLVSTMTPAALLLIYFELKSRRKDGN